MSTVSLRSLTTTWAADLVAAFDASGVHRVGTPGDLASGAWFAEEAAQSGGHSAPAGTDPVHAR